MTFWNGVLWLHLLGMAFFVGGQLMLAGVVVPLLRGQWDRTLMLAAARRFGAGSGIAFLVLLVTGVAMASHEHKWHSSTLQVKLGLIVLIVAFLGLHARKPDWHWVEPLVFALSVAVVWLGIALAG